MSAIMSLIKTHPVLAYFGLTFAISWGGFVLAVGPGGIPAAPQQFERMPLLAILMMLVGPSVAGMLLTGLVSGRAGLYGVLSRLLRWRVGARWYAVALLTAPLLFTAVLVPLSLIAPVFRPGVFASDAKASLVLMSIVVALVVGILEELGWTGFAVPRLRLRYTVLGTGFVVGVVWGAWHVLANDIWASAATAGDVQLARFAVLRGIGLLAGGLLAFRVLMVWVYDRTDGSLLLVTLMHASYAACTFILGPAAISGASLLTYDLVAAVAAWIVVGAVAMVFRGQLSQSPRTSGNADLRVVE